MTPQPEVGYGLFSRTVEYALRAAVFLASRHGGPATTEEVARRTQVPAPYLAKILQGLTRAGLVRSQRGVGGGVALAKAPGEMTILEVVNAVDPIRRIKTCPLKLASHGTRLCPLHRRLDNALSMVEEAFGSTTLAEVLAEPSASVPLCDVPGGDGKRVPLTVKKR
jgi:Rrf2 family protein